MLDGEDFPKRRRGQRPCDMCRKKKVRCDNTQEQGSRCSNCVTNNYECTYVEDAQRRGYSKNYVEALENRVKKMETFIRQFRGIEDGQLPTMNTVTSNQQSREKFLDACIDLIRQWDADRPDTEDNKAIYDEETAELEYTQHITKATDHSQFLGRSSEVFLLQSIIDYKSGGRERITELKPGISFGRHEYWKVQEWETITEERTTLQFPDNDLLEDLVELYFSHYNVAVPLLHRPTFERQVRQGLHHQDPKFGAIVLLVCAVAARSSPDPRVRLKGTDSGLSAGWDWFHMVHPHRPSLIGKMTLYDLQYCVLAAEFQRWGATFSSSWVIVGLGLRIALEMGVHRRSVNEKITVEDELSKRAFWCLVVLDYSLSAPVGRPCGIQDEDFDQAMPIECDDEYWEHPNPDLAFKQPPGTISYITAFNVFIKLMRILSMVLRMIYPISKSEMVTGLNGPEWQERIVAMLDSSLNNWADSIPEHLRWDPNRRDEIFFNQSAILYTHYYQLQILVHRPFIVQNAQNKKRFNLPFPSLAICTNAARSCSHIADTMRRRKGKLIYMITSPTFTAAIILLLNIWGGKRSGWSSDPDKEMAEVHKCMKVLKEVGERIIGAGRVWDVLYQLASVGDLAVPAASPSPLNSEDGMDSIPHTPASSIMSMPVHSPTHTFPLVSPELGHQTSTLANYTNIVPQHQYFALPVHSHDLGRLPVHGRLNYTAQTPDVDTASSEGGYWFTPMSAMTDGQGLATGDHFDSDVSLLLQDLALPVNHPSWADMGIFDYAGAPQSQSYQAPSHPIQSQRSPHHTPQQTHPLWTNEVYGPSMFTTTPNP